MVRKWNKKLAGNKSIKIDKILKMEGKNGGKKCR